jgi:hypothetical protein
MKRILGWSSRKSFLSLGLLLSILVWGVATWSRSQRPGHQAAMKRYFNNPLLESMTWLEVTVGPVSQ